MSASLIFARRLKERLTADQRLMLLVLLLMAIRLTCYAWLSGGLITLPDAVCRWDCGWYIGAAEDGYALYPKTDDAGSNDQANWAFFPAFPLTVRVLSGILDISPLLTAFIVVNACFCIFVFLSVKYLRLPDQGARIAAAVFLFSFPFGFYLSVPYTESLYAMLTITAFYLLQRDRLIASSIMAALLSATRLTGILLAPIICLRYFSLTANSYWNGGKKAAARELRQAILPVALAPLGLFLFMTYLYVHVGDALAFIHVQRAWGRTLQNPFTVFTRGIVQFDLGSIYARQSASGMFSSLCVLAGLGLALWLVLKRRYETGYFLLASTLIPLSDGLPSLPRYIMANPVFMVTLFEFVWTTKYRIFFAEIILGCILWQLYLVHLWILGFVSLI